MNEDRQPLKWIALGGGLSVVLSLVLIPMVLGRFDEGSASPGLNDVLFEDDFETGLGAWLPRSIGHNAEVVADPLGTHGDVVRFTAVVANGDLFTPALPVDAAATYTLSFEYLGLPSGPVPAGGLGGFIGLSDDVDFPTPHAWIAGTQPDQVTNLLVDDGAWHEYAFTFAPRDYFEPSSGTVRVMLEDFEGSGTYAADAAPADAYFDNVRLVRE